MVRGDRKEADGESKFDRPVIIRRDRALPSGAVAGRIVFVFCPPRASCLSHAIFVAFLES